MCSNTFQHQPPPATAAVLAQAIDELAEVASAADDAELAVRLARIWAMIADADPELAARTEKYSRSPEAKRGALGSGPSSAEVPS